MFKPLTRAALTVAVVTASLHAVSVAAQTMTVDQARKQIAPFYEMLNQPATKDVKALSEQALSPDWKSYSSETEFKGRDGFVAQVGGFGKLIPDLKWDIKDVMVDGNRIIVRSEASGTPVVPFFGVPPSGKSFKIMTIDIHTIKDGKAITAHHVEDWAGAIRQLSAKQFLTPEMDSVNPFPRTVRSSRPLGISHQIGDVGLVVV
ncbi:MAG: hypothetical protein EAZ30_07970 [Betaproteobacteria bacterium]|nr:MAG: hypothetical protein EAZ30_07970 [Betaproteobacteria bacterium]